jgi:hypothetical protein
VIGKAAIKIQRVGPVLTTKNAEIPWQVMYAMLNRLSYCYGVGADCQAIKISAIEYSKS